MKTLHLVFAFTLVGCASSSTGTSDPKPSTDGNGKAPATTVRTTLSYDGTCSASTCGEVPASNSASAPVCSPVASSGACSWTAPDPNGVVSFRPCSDAECPTTVPDKSVCPTDLEFKGASCGAENDGACIWRAACVPPRSTTPCPDASGCGDVIPELGVICKDGSNGSLACFQLANGTCALQPTCE